MKKSEIYQYAKNMIAQRKDPVLELIYSKISNTEICDILAQNIREPTYPYPKIHKHEFLNIEESNQLFSNLQETKEKYVKENNIVVVADIKFGDLIYTNQINGQDMYYVVGRYSNREIIYTEFIDAWSADLEVIYNFPLRSWSNLCKDSKYTIVYLDIHTLIDKISLEIEFFNFCFMNINYCVIYSWFRLYGYSYGVVGILNDEYNKNNDVEKAVQLYMPSFDLYNPKDNMNVTKNKFIEFLHLDKYYVVSLNPDPFVNINADFETKNKVNKYINDFYNIIWYQLDKRFYNINSHLHRNKLVFIY